MPRPQYLHQALTLSFQPAVLLLSRGCVLQVRPSQPTLSHLWDLACLETSLRDLDPAPCQRRAMGPGSCAVRRHAVIKHRNSQLGLA
mmetsp:Transcript_17472/g.40905  ORF Transcript_17472/g.40905 Transcript_17472/m.40905 type:complete len:87 (+) Transcript_17472:623-883(+)